MIEEIYAQVGEQITLARKSIGITQEDLAGLIGLSRVSIVNIEQGRQRLQLHTLISIAIATDVPLTFFFPDLESGEFPSIQIEVFGEKDRDRVIEILEKTIHSIQAP